MSKQLTRPKVILDGVDISHKVKGFTRSAEYQYITTYDIFYFDGTEQLGVDSIRVKVTFPKENK